MPKRRRDAGSGGLYKRSNGLWVGAVTLPSVDGVQRRRTVSSRDRGIALKKLRELRAAVNEGLVSTTSNMTLGRWLDYWIDHIRGPHVRPNTRAFYADSIRLHIKPAIGGKRLGHLTPVHVRAMLESIDSTRSRQRAHLVLRLALKSAMAEGLIRRNVTDAVPKPLHVAESRGAFDAPTAGRIIATAFHARVGPWSPHVLCQDEAQATRWAAAFLTGARQGELLGLRWPYVDLDQGVIELAWQLQQMEQIHGCVRDTDGNPTCGRRFRCPLRTYPTSEGFEGIPLVGSLALTRPKSKAGVRVVPLVAPLWAAMVRLREIGPVNDYDLVWATAEGQPIGPREDHRAWKALLTRADVADMPLHAARHTTSTLLQAAGVDEDTRMKITGHSSAAAHRNYVHVNQTQTRAALSLLSSLMPSTDAAGQKSS